MISIFTRKEPDLRRELSAALEHRQLELYYQPKVHALSGQISGAEALVRWNHPTRGLLGPVTFLPAAERLGIIGELGSWVIDEACSQARRWRTLGLRMRLSINVSALQFRQPDLTFRLAGALALYGLPPELLTCEVTESSAMDDAEATRRAMREMGELGVQISIDDFGTGHSSLAYLRRFSFNELKIDRSFVFDIEQHRSARKLVAAIVGLGKSLDLVVVAEGVETEGQQHILRELGCDQLQGYFFGRPMCADALLRWAVSGDGPSPTSFRPSLYAESGIDVLASPS